MGWTHRKHRKHRKHHFCQTTHCYTGRKNTNGPARTQAHAAYTQHVLVPQRQASELLARWSTFLRFLCTPFHQSKVHTKLDATLRTRVQQVHREVAGATRHTAGKEDPRRHKCSKPLTDPHKEIVVKFPSADALEMRPLLLLDDAALAGIRLEVIDLRDKVRAADTNGIWFGSRENGQTSQTAHVKGNEHETVWRRASVAPQRTEGR